MGTRHTWWLVATIGLLALAQGSRGEDIDTAIMQEVAAAAGGQESLLRWALANSNPQELQRQAETAQRLSNPSDPKELAERQARVQQLLHAMQQNPSEADLMKEALSTLRNDTAGDGEHLAALQALALLVEPIDNANDLHKMDGLQPVLEHLAGPPALAAAAAHVLATCSSNNPTFQVQLLEQHPEVLRSLLRLLNSNGSSKGSESSSSSATEGSQEAEEVAGKSMLALAAVLRNHGPARASFYEAGGMRTLLGLLSGSGSPLRLQRRALGLLTDLVQLDAPALAAATRQRQLPVEDGLAAAGLDVPAAVHTVLQLLQAAPGDLDVQEKAALLLLQLLDSQPRAVQSLLREAGGMAVLTQLRRQLEAAVAAATDEDEAYHEGEVLAYVKALQGWLQANAGGGAAPAMAAHDEL